MIDRNETAKKYLQVEDVKASLQHMDVFGEQIAAAKGAILTDRANTEKSRADTFTEQSNKINDQAKIG